jgi:tetratricopeptide (TPR) repeat protein
MTFRDRYGLTLTTSSSAAADHYRAALDHSLAGNAPAETTFDAAIAADDGFALAYVGKARLAQFRGAAAEAKANIARARELAPAATRREQQQIEAVGVAIDGNSARSLELVHEHLAEFPRDAYVASQAMGVYGLIGFSGRQDRNAEQLDFCEKLAPAYGDDWWFLANHAFALNELFRTKEARPLAERSIALYERNGHAAHTMAHVFYEEGDVPMGAKFLERWLVGYEPGAQLYGHVTWHLALFELIAGETGKALEIYDRVLRPTLGASTALGVIADSASFLWRTGLATEEDLSARWPEVGDFAAKAFPRAGITFADVHCALALAAAGNQACMGPLIDSLKERLEAGKIAAGPVVVALAEGAVAFAAGDYETAIRHMEPLRHEVVRVGGSHAQRDVFEETLLEAYLRAGHQEAAAALLTERLERRPSLKDERDLARAKHG